MTRREQLRAALADAAPIALAALRTLCLEALDHDLADAIVARLAPVVEQANDARLWQLLALAERERHHAAEAHAAFARAAALAPHDAKIAEGRAVTALEAGYPAGDWFVQARRLAPGDGGLRIGHASALLAEGDAAGALALLSEALAANPGWREGHDAFARIAASGATGVDPVASLVAALRLRRRDPALWAQVVEVLLRARDHRRALDALSKARGLTGDSLEWRRAEAICHAECGAPERAAALFASLPLPDRAAVLIHPIRTLIRLERFEEAAALAERPVPPAEAAGLWPYRALLWRRMGDPRWDWLEGDPRLIGVYDLDPDRVDLDALATLLRRLHQGIGTPIDQSVRVGSQTDGFLLARAEPEIHALRAELARLVAAHVAQLPPPVVAHPTLGIARDGPIAFAGAWSVRLTGGGGHHDDHVHPEGWFSSALYVAVPDAAERGEAPDAGWLGFGACRSLLPDLAPFRRIEPRPGRLVLFPSTLWHGTMPFAAGERMTVAFDVAPPRG